ncbi:MAG: ATP-binding cassette domain-containing protein [Planctomycetes bacterium]|nr:ATP-binding cassette domain-containing protein [Planctomycetota bacterium]
MYALELNNVCKSFGQVHAVEGLSVKVPVGSIYGFLGPNGAGKTTTLRMVVNILRPDSGSITLFENGTEKQTRNHVGYMPEERGLYRKMTVRKTLTYFASLKGVPANEISRNVSQWLERIELGKWADKKVEDLSRGMHQKLQFAVTVINAPSLVILDEPFAGLDPLNYEMMKNIILEMRDAGKTILFSTHIMHEAETLCDSILLINKGKNILDGRLSDIRSRNHSDSVLVELDGDAGILGTLPMAAGVRPRQNQMEITLKQGGDPQELLAALAGKVRIRRFEIKTHSLHEIFIQLVGADNA